MKYTSALGRSWMNIKASEVRKSKNSKKRASYGKGGR